MENYIIYHIILVIKMLYCVQIMHIIYAYSDTQQLSKEAFNKVKPEWYGK